MQLLYFTNHYLGNFFLLLQSSNIFKVWYRWSLTNESQPEPVGVVYAPGTPQN